MGGDAFAQRVERRNIVSQPARNCFAIGETDIAVHFGTSGSQARHIAETVTRELRSIVPGLAPRDALHQHGRGDKGEMAHARHHAIVFLRLQEPRARPKRIDECGHLFQGGVSCTPRGSETVHALPEELSISRLHAAHLFSGDGMPADESNGGRKILFGPADDLDFGAGDIRYHRSRRSQRRQLLQQ